jgi:hypothetical protein
MELFCKYFTCCLACCIPRKKSRKDIRAEWKAAQQNAASSSSVKDDDSKKREELENKQASVSDSENFSNKPDSSIKAPSLEERIKSSVKIQAVVRGFLGRVRAYNKWLEAVEEADRYWNHIIWLRDEEERQRQSIENARKEFVFQYCKDVLDTSALFVSQASEATTVIQRLWRGYSTRKNLPTKPPPTERRVKVPKRERFKPSTLRRVWARSQYEPSTSTYLHHTDFGYLEYDLWEYQDHPPQGYSVGLKNRKVRATFLSFLFLSLSYPFYR